MLIAECDLRQRQYGGIQWSYISDDGNCQHRYRKSLDSMDSKSLANGLHSMATGSPIAQSPSPPAFMQAQPQAQLAQPQPQLSTPPPPLQPPNLRVSSSPLLHSRRCPRARRPCPWQSPCPCHSPCGCDPAKRRCFIYRLVCRRCLVLVVHVQYNMFRSIIVSKP